MNTIVLDEITTRCRDLIFGEMERGKRPKKITVHLSEMDNFMLKDEIKYLPHNVVKESDSEPVPPNMIFGTPLDIVVGDTPCIAISIL